MLIIELFEDISKNTALKTICDILVVQLPNLHDKILSMAEKFTYNNGPLDKRFYFTSGGARTQWWQDIYMRSLNPALHTLASNLPKPAKQKLLNFLSSNAGKDNSDMIIPLITILRDIANQTGNKELLSATDTATHGFMNFKKKLDEINDEAIRYDNEQAEKVASRRAANGLPSPEKVEPTPSALGGQMQQVQGVVNDVISRMNREDAARAREHLRRRPDNQLQTLQAFINANGIQLR